MEFPARYSVITATFSSSPCDCVFPAWLGQATTNAAIINNAHHPFKRVATVPKRFIPIIFDYYAQTESSTSISPSSVGCSDAPKRVQQRSPKLLHVTYIRTTATGLGGTKPHSPLTRRTMLDSSGSCRITRSPSTSPTFLRGLSCFWELARLLPAFGASLPCHGVVLLPHDEDVSTLRRSRSANNTYLANQGGPSMRELWVRFKYGDQAKD